MKVRMTRALDFRVVLGLLLAGCGRQTQDPVSVLGSPPAFQAIVSNPSGPQPAADTVYVSLPPGTVPGGISVTVENPRARTTASGAVVEGGFDPIPIAASAGDTLRISIRQDDGSVVVSIVMVPSRRPLILVRTDPPPGKRDVPLNASLQVVVSEPVDPASLDRGAIMLRGGGEIVSLEATEVPESPGVVRILLFRPLDPETDYELVVTRGLLSVDGEGLSEAVVVHFTTAALPEPPPLTGMGMVWGFVVMDSGICIPGAVVTIIAGPGTGQSMRQEGPCDAWDYANGFEFRLPIGARVTLRATAEGYRPREEEHVAENPATSITILLTPE